MDFGVRIRKETSKKEDRTKLNMSVVKPDMWWFAISAATIVCSLHPRLDHRSAFNSKATTQSKLSIQNLVRNDRSDQDSSRALVVRSAT
jgi:hypothetical protein